LLKFLPQSQGQLSSCDQFRCSYPEIQTDSNYLMHFGILPKKYIFPLQKELDYYRKFNIHLVEKTARTLRQIQHEPKDSTRY